ncbi:argonaute 5 [Coemansia sp. BCRC 34301]|nr:argonaute 5 [Coemansia sp. BCRC 34301]
MLKRQNTRFFPVGRDGDRTENCVPGTVIDRSVTMPGMVDLYLFARAAIQDTSCPTHCYVLHDDAKFTVDAIQKLTYHLCYTYTISTRSVLLVPPVYYAHRVADRARYHLVDMGRSFDKASTKTAGYYRGAGLTAVGTAPGDLRMATRIFCINKSLAETMYFM